MYKVFTVLNSVTARGYYTVIKKKSLKLVYAVWCGVFLINYM